MTLAAANVGFSNGGFTFLAVSVNDHPPVKPEQAIVRTPG